MTSKHRCNAILLLFFSIWRIFTGIDGLPGQYVQVYTNQHSYILFSDLGIEIGTTPEVYFELKTCVSAVITIGSEETLTSNYVRFLIGGSYQFVAINYDCWLCYTAHAYENLTDCDEYRAFWIQWSKNGYFGFGKGTNASDTSTTVTSTSKEPITVREIGLAITGIHTASWRLLKDNAPIFRMPKSDGTTTVNVIEKQPINSTILSASGVDPEGDPLTFSVVGNYTNKFSFQNDTLVTSDILVLAFQAIYVIDLRISDGRNEQYTNFTLKLLPASLDGVLTVGKIREVIEELTIGTVIHSLFQLQETHQQLIFLLHGNDSNYFDINSTTGSITIAKRIDRESLLDDYLDDLVVIIISTDTGLNTSLTLNITITDINDNIPTCITSSFYIEIPENSTKDAHVVDLMCDDKDIGRNGIKYLNITQQNELTPLLNVTQSAIYIDGSQLDLETMSTDHYYIVMKISDDPLVTTPFVTTFYFQVKITGRNEFDPIFTSPPIQNGSFPSITVNENETICSVIWTANATDEDRGKDGELGFYIPSVTSDKGHSRMYDFTISSDGVLSTKRELDRDSPINGVIYYDVAIGVQDGGLESRSSLANLRIYIADANDNYPVFSQDVYHITILCDADINVTWNPFVVTDLDSSANITFKMLTNDEGLIMVSEDGNISLRHAPKSLYERNPGIVRILAVDNGSPPKSAQCCLVYSFSVCHITSLNPNTTTLHNKIVSTVISNDNASQDNVTFIPEPSKTSLTTMKSIAGLSMMTPVQNLVFTCSRVFTTVMLYVVFIMNV